MTEQEAIEEVVAGMGTFMDDRCCSEEEEQKVQAAIDIAVNALEKQIPKKPIDKGCLHRSLRCPICHCEVELNNGMQLGYCENCGQAIDWSE